MIYVLFLNTIYDPQVDINNQICHSFSTIVVNTRHQIINDKPAKLGIKRLWI